MKIKRFFKWFFILIAAAIVSFIAIGAISTTYRLATEKDVTEAEAEKNARKKLGEFCKMKLRKCDPSRYFVSARMHGIDPTDSDHGSPWHFQFSDSTGAPRRVVDIAVDIKGNPDFAGFGEEQTPASSDFSYDTGIRERR